jgi:hypothetical protein
MYVVCSGGQWEADYIHYHRLPTTHYTTRAWKLMHTNTNASALHVPWQERHSCPLVKETQTKQGAAQP